MRDVVWFFGMGLWLLASAGGMVALGRYEFSAGRAAHADVVWPAASSLRLDPHKVTVVVAAHPRCPCTAAAMRELELVLQRNPQGARTYVLFFEPPGAGPEWRETSLWQHATQLPGCQALPDPEGRIAKAFDAHTSGQVVAYSPAGRLLFAGGITGSRGHSGDNRGSQSLANVVAGRLDQPIYATEVFGCALDDPKDQEGEEQCGKCPLPK
jgi:hypothetical protein